MESGRVVKGVVLGIVFLCLAVPGLSLAAVKYDDRDALQDMQAVKALFDINVSKPAKLEFYLRVISQTHADLLRQGVAPEMVIAFRGASVRLISTENWSFTDEDQDLLLKSKKYLQELHGLGVKIEACALATGLFKVENSTILPEVKLVGNTFVSLIGYQHQGFALIPIQ